MYFVIICNAPVLLLLMETQGILRKSNNTEVEGLLFPINAPSKHIHPFLSEISKYKAWHL